MKTATPETDIAPECRPPIVVPLLILAIGTGLIRFLNLDLKTTALFHAPDGTWPWDHKAWIELLYHYGTIPAIVVAVVGLVMFTASFRIDSWKCWRRDALCAALVLAIGPGLLVNAVFKDHFGRPRPREVREFGGDQTFLPVLQPDFGAPGRSFPSGHASMGFYWLGLGACLWAHRRRLAVALLALGFIHGGLMGLARIAQGAHWLSDILWAAGFVYLGAWVLCRVLPPAPAYSASAERP